MWCEFSKVSNHKLPNPIRPSTEKTQTLVVASAILAVKSPFSPAIQICGHEAAMIVNPGFYLHIHLGKFMELASATNHPLPVKCSIISISLSATCLRMIPNDPHSLWQTSLTCWKKDTFCRRSRLGRGGCQRGVAPCQVSDEQNATESVESSLITLKACKAFQQNEQWM